MVERVEDEIANLMSEELLNVGIGGKVDKEIEGSGTDDG
jgi:hypothetical protein